MDEKINPQRCRLTHEFVLKNRGDYELFRRTFQQFFKMLEKNSMDYQGDYLVIEKVEEKKE